MGLTLPLAVRLKTSSADRHVTRDLRDLQCRSTVPGGFASATITLDRPLDTQPTEIDYYGSLYVYDRRSGAVVFEGQVEDPGRTAADGEIWQLTAVGPAARAQDRTVPLIYVDQSIADGWHRNDNATAPQVKVGVEADPGQAGTDNQAIVITFPGGTSVATNDLGIWRYVGITNCGQKLARVALSWDSNSNAAWSVEVIANGGGSTTLLSTAFVNTGGSIAKVVVTDFANGRDTIDVRGKYTGAGTNPSIANWCSFSNVVLVALRLDKTGAEVTSGYTTNSVLASDVVADLLGRLLNKYDGANATIAATSNAIANLAYPGGASPDTILNDLMVFEPDFYWAAWESNSAGLYRFEWSQWPTTVRYEASVYDGFDSPGSAVDLYNTVRVRYRTFWGAVQTVQRSLAVTALTNAGLTREAMLDITGIGPCATSHAQLAGDRWLVAHNTPPNAGTLTVARPIRDLVTGALVQPWEIRPGNLIRVRGVLPRVDALNPTARDGVTIFRITANDFQASTAAAQLELDSPPLRVSHYLQKLKRRTDGGGGILH